MDVILLERIEKLGQMGDVVRVKPGYARNYLLPQKKAVRATDENRKQFEERRVQLEATNLERRAEAEAAAARMSGVAVVLIRQAGEAGQLYGSVSTRDIADAVSEAGFTIRRQQVRLNQPIKAVGLYEVPVALHPEVSVMVTVNVARSHDEADSQGRTATAPTGSQQAEVAAVTEDEEALEGIARPDEAEQTRSS